MAKFNKDLLKQSLINCVETVDALKNLSKDDIVEKVEDLKYLAKDKTQKAVSIAIDEINKAESTEQLIENISDKVSKTYKNSIDDTIQTESLGRYIITISSMFDCNKDAMVQDSKGNILYYIKYNESTDKFTLLDTNKKFLILIEGRLEKSLLKPLKGNEGEATYKSTLKGMIYKSSISSLIIIANFTGKKCKFEMNGEIIGESQWKFIGPYSYILYLNDLTYLEEIVTTLLASRAIKIPEPDTSTDTSIFPFKKKEKKENTKRSGLFEKIKDIPWTDDRDVYYEPINIHSDNDEDD